MPTISRLLQRVFATGAGLSMAFVFGIIFLNSLRRYTTGASLRWGEELPIYLTIYGVMFGIALAYLQDSHIRFTILTDFLPEKMRSRLFAAMDLVTAATGAALIWSGIAFASRRGNVEASGIISTARDLAETTGFESLIWIGRMGTWQSAIAFGGILLTIAALVRFASRLQEA
jgi:TRAP-type C4-dicarboxylate transport system permease small subunit